MKDIISKLDSKIILTMITSVGSFAIASYLVYYITQEHTGDMERTIESLDSLTDTITEQNTVTRQLLDIMISRQRADLTQLNGR